MTEPKNHFERLGLPRRFSVDLAELETSYLARSREVHPDFHAVEGTSTDDASAALNQAYTTLKDPFRRAEHLLDILGGPTASDEKNLEPAFLMEAMELREQIENQHLTRNEAERDAIDADLVARMKSVEADIAALFAGAAPDLLAIRRKLNVWKTLRSLRRSLSD
jgi:molecular chaperone HscB